MKFAMRLSVLGMAFIAMFSIIGLRLWFVQVAEGPAQDAIADPPATFEVRRLR